MHSPTVEAEIHPTAIDGIPQPKTPIPPRKLVSSLSESGQTVVRVGAVAIGAGQPVVIAGPCSVESYEQTRATAEAVKAAGAVILRGGAYNPLGSRGT
jgi:3-deoxy-D-arabino-heptulosonate 7-phosphate (DAHP) synthase